MNIFNFNKINLNKVFRISLGSTLSYLISTLIGLEYSASAAVITLLSIQDTRRETTLDVFKRILSYLYAMLSAYFLFTHIGYNALAFFIFMTLLVLMSHIFNITNTLSSSTVVTTHFLLRQNFSLNSIYNEVMLLFIGTTIALVLNIFLRDKSKKIARDSEIIELDISELLKKTVLYFKGEKDFDEEWFAFIYDKLGEFRDNVIDNSYNVEFEKSHYYNEYAGMRKEQCRTIGRIHSNFEKSPNKNIPLLEDICSVFYKISTNIHNKSAYKDDLIYVKEIITKFDNLPLPTTKEDLITYTCTSDILQELYFFVELNYKFIKQLSNIEIDSYWT